MVGSRALVTGLKRQNRASLPAQSTEALTVGLVGQRVARRVVLVPSQGAEPVIIHLLTTMDKTVVVTTFKRLAVKLHLVLVLSMVVLRHGLHGAHAQNLPTVCKVLRPEPEAAPIPLRQMVATIVWGC